MKSLKTGCRSKQDGEQKTASFLMSFRHYGQMLSVSDFSRLGAVYSPSARKTLMTASITVSALGMIAYGLVVLLQHNPLNRVVTPPDECQFLGHLGLPGSYQRQADGSILCHSRVRHLGAREQHSLRYLARGSIAGIDEMRISLRMGEKGQAEALDELLRFGQSLSLPVIGHTLPVDVGLYLKSGRGGHWDFPKASLVITRGHSLSDKTQSIPSQGGDFEDVELIFRKNTLH